MRMRLSPLVLAGGSLVALAALAGAAYWINRPEPEIVLYAGSMLRPAIEDLVKDFEKRERVKVTRVYNGCGILVGQMEAVTPDVFFACDTSFMQKVEDKFQPSKNVSNNQLMIIVKKGNPHEIKKLTDLAKKGLKVGVGHEHQCALGQLTQQTFTITGIYNRIMKNIVVRAPSGDYLVTQMLTGSLDVVIAYKSNVLPYPNELEGIPITGIGPCETPAQPIAVAKDSKHPEIAQRLADFLQSDEARQRFEKVGFGWEAK